MSSIIVKIENSRWARVVLGLLLVRGVIKLLVGYVRSRMLALHRTIPLPDYESQFEAKDVGMLGATRTTLLTRVAAYHRFPKGTSMYREMQLNIISAVCTTNPDHVPMVNKLNRSFPYSVVANFLGKDGILFQDGERGKRDRHRLNTAFAAERLQEGLFPVMLDSARKLKQRLEAKRGQQYDAGAEYVSTTFTIVAQGSFGVNVDDSRGNFMRLLEMGVNPVAFLPGGVPLVKWYYSDILAAVGRTTQSIIGLRTDRNAAATEEEPNDLLRLMMAIEGDTIEGVPKRKWVQDQMTLFIFAGMDTTACALTFLTALLVRFPQYQTMIHDEVAAVVAGNNSNNGELQFQDIAKLHMTEAIIKETVRLYPPVAGISRAANGEDVVDGVLIPIGTSFMIDVLNMQRREDFFSNPDEFIPERWIEGMSKETATEQAFMPFSTGARSCIGRKFAMLEMKTILAVLLGGGRRFTAQSPTPGMPDASSLKGVHTPTEPVVVSYG